MIRVLALTLALCSPALAEDQTHTRQTGDFPCNINQFEGLPKIAERLGVKPDLPNTSPALALTLCDGRQYDFIAILNAVLDRIDAIQLADGKK
jgi:hypothetical protein